MAKTTAAMRRKRRALAVPDVWLPPTSPGQFLVLRLKRGRKVLQRTLTREEAEFLVWMLAWHMLDCTEGANTPEEALLHAFKRGRAPWDFVEARG